MPEASSLFLHFHQRGGVKGNDGYVSLGQAGSSLRIILGHFLSPSFFSQLQVQQYQVEIVLKKMILGTFAIWRQKLFPLRPF